jgi:hypothetical protein
MLGEVVESPKPKTQDPKKFQIPSTNVVVFKLTGVSTIMSAVRRARSDAPYHRGER